MLVDLVCISTSWLLWNIEAAVVSREAAAGPVCVIKIERTLVLRVPWILDADAC